MIRKSMLAAVAFILLGLTFIFIPEQAEAARYRKYLRIRYEGRYPYVRIHVNGISKGKCYRGSRLSVYLRTGRTYRVRASYAGRSHTQSVYLPRNFGGRYKLVTFTRPSRGRRIDPIDRPTRRRARLRIRYRGRRPYARCYINGESKGKISRHSSRLFSVRRGRTYRIQMRFAGRTRTKSVYISRSQGSTRVVTFYGP